MRVQKQMQVASHSTRVREEERGERREARSKQTDRVSSVGVVGGLRKSAEEVNVDWGGAWFSTGFSTGFTHDSVRTGGSGGSGLAGGLAGLDNISWCVKAGWWPSRSCYVLRTYYMRTRMACWRVYRVPWRLLSAAGGVFGLLRLYQCGCRLPGELAARTYGHYRH